MTIDPVCKMNVEPDNAVAKVQYAGNEYHFCSDACYKTFVAKPENTQVAWRLLTTNAVVGISL